MYRRREEIIMREIIFRGKRKDDGEWVEGSLINAFEYTCILQAEDKLHPMDYPYLDGDIGTFDGKATPVIPETVGQYTGLTDKNGQKIFEGDVVEYRTLLDLANMVVFFEDGEFRLVDCKRYSTYLPGSGFFTVRKFEKEIVGNIHDNPELLKAEFQSEL